jgi:hypothetical protein
MCSNDFDKEKLNNFLVSIGSIATVPLLHILCTSSSTSWLGTFQNSSHESMKEEEKQFKRDD